MGDIFSQTHPNTASSQTFSQDFVEPNAMSAVTNPPYFQLGDTVRDTQQLQSPTHRSSVSPLRICLPDPPSLYPSLIAIGAEQRIAKEMERAYNARVLELRSYYEISITNAFAVFTDSPSHHASAKRILDTFANLYLTKVKSWIEDGVAAYKSRSNRKSRRQVTCDDELSTGANPRRAFNNDYVPLLEHFFDENPFPTHADKVFLAKKSGMTYRQIHVWFQNRRNRTKKVLHRKPVSEGPTAPLDILIRRMGKFAVPSAMRLDSRPCSQRIPIPTEAHNVLNGVASPHAFPTTYPPTCGYDPFPAVPTFNTPEWPRRPALSSEWARQSVADVDEVNEKFSRLNVWDDSVSRSRRRAGKMACNSFAATIAITIKPSPAPHPACVLTAVAEKPLPRIALQSVAATTPSLHVFRPPSPGTPMTTLIPTNNHRRKIVPLPNQFPSRRPRGTSGSSTSSASSSRSSSLESETPISNSSSTVTTPETSPSPLRHDNL